MKSVIPVTTVEIKTACSQCNLRSCACPSASSTRGSTSSTSSSAAAARSSGSSTCTARRPFEAICAIRAGSFKTDVILEDGRDQVTGFQMTGEVLGLDGISTEHHSCNAIALEDSEVCVIPFSLEGCRVRWRACSTSSTRS